VVLEHTAVAMVGMDQITLFQAQVLQTLAVVEGEQAVLLTTALLLVALVALVFVLLLGLNKEE
jgi:hypothetical protein